MCDSLTRLAYTAAALSRKASLTPRHLTQYQQYPRHDFQHLQQHRQQQLFSGAAADDPLSDCDDFLLVDTNARGDFSNEEPSTVYDDDVRSRGVPALPRPAYECPQLRQQPPARTLSDGGLDMPPLPPAPASGGDHDGVGNDGGGGGGFGEHKRLRVPSPGVDGGEEGSEGGGKATIKRPGSRRPVQFWGTFNGECDVHDSRIVLAKPAHRGCRWWYVSAVRNNSNSVLQDSECSHLRSRFNGSPWVCYSHPNK